MYPMRRYASLLAQRHQLLRGGVVCFGAAAFGHHAAYGKLVSGDGFGEIPLRLHGDGDDPFAGTVLSTPGTGGKEEQKKKSEDGRTSGSSPREGEGGGDCRAVVFGWFS